MFNDKIYILISKVAKIYVKPPVLPYSLTGETALWIKKTVI